MTDIATIRLGWSNAHLVLGERAVLFDAGSPGDERAILAALAPAGIRPGDLALIVLGQGHADHAGAAAALRDATGAPLVLGRADAALVTAGESGTLVARGLEARLIRPFVPTRFRAFAPDLLVDDTLDLTPYGVAGTLRALPGHTPGSLALWLSGGDVLAGDVIRGGGLGGRVGAARPHGHYFQSDAPAAFAAARTLLAEGAGRLHLGHGGPVDAAAAAAYLSRA